MKEKTIRKHFQGSYSCKKLSELCVPFIEKHLDVVELSDINFIKKEIERMENKGIKMAIFIHKSKLICTRKYLESDKTDLRGSVNQVQSFPYSVNILKNELKTLNYKNLLYRS